MEKKEAKEGYSSWRKSRGPWEESKRGESKDEWEDHLQLNLLPSEEPLAAKPLLEVFTVLSMTRLQLASSNNVVSMMSFLMPCNALEIDC